MASGRTSAGWRLALALVGAMALAGGAYRVLGRANAGAGLIGLTFLLVLPAMLSALVAFLADPRAERRLGAYLMVPVYLVGLVVLVSAVVLREGVICILMLSPLWLLAGMAGAALTWWLRRRTPDTSVFASGLLVLPLLTAQAEPYLQLPDASIAVTRSAVVEADPERLWPLLRGIPDVKPGEGRWNVSQDVIGLPRPLGARLVGDGLGAERLANWGRHVHFRERIVDWQPGRRIGWRFIFDDVAGWDFVDPHLRPNSRFFRVTAGGYALQPLGPGRTRVTLTTRYRLRTPVNAYARAWGELFLGDLETNLLALVKGRAERAQPPRVSVTKLYAGRSPSAG